MRKTSCILSLPILAAWTAAAAVVIPPSLDSPYNQCAFLATHNAFANPDDYVTFSLTDEYRRIQTRGRVVLGRGGAFSFTLRLEARRLGGDRDGRQYVVRLNATDRVGHASQTTMTVPVPHDRR